MINRREDDLRDHQDVDISTISDVAELRRMLAETPAIIDGPEQIALSHGVGVYNLLDKGDPDIKAYRGGVANPRYKAIESRIAELEQSDN